MISKHTLTQDISTEWHDGKRDTYRQVDVKATLYNKSAAAIHITSNRPKASRLCITITGSDNPDSVYDLIGVDDLNDIIKGLELFIATWVQAQEGVDVAIAAAIVKQLEK